MQPSPGSNSSFEPHPPDTTSPEETQGENSAAESEWVYGKLYTSEVWILEHAKVKCIWLLPSEAGCTLEQIIVALMFWLDSTHLTNFGAAKIWPIYMMLGNLTKYIRCVPTSGACHHIAYISYVSAIYSCVIAHFWLVAAISIATQ